MITRRRLLNQGPAAISAYERGQRVAPTGRHVKANTWYSIVNHRKADLASVYIYDEIGFWGVTASDFVRELNAIDAKNIDVHINSPGGDVFDGIAIYNAIASHAANVTVYVDGLAASAASFIAQAGSPIKIGRNAAMMIHDAEGICIGNAASMLEMSDLLNSASNNIADIYAGKNDTPIDQWRDRMRATSWYHTGQDAVDAGLADIVYEPDSESGDGNGDTTSSADNASNKSEHRQPANRVANTVCPAPESDTVDPGTGEPDTEIGQTEVDAPDVRVGSTDDLAAWWNPDIFRAAVGTAADQHRLYGFEADAFREIIRVASENCPYPEPPPIAIPVTNEPEPTVDSAEFLKAIRRGLL
jgi:ATP-dependent protease ClpP protease subunit